MGHNGKRFLRSFSRSSTPRRAEGDVYLLVLLWKWEFKKQFVLQSSYKDRWISTKLCFSVWWPALLSNDFKHWGPSQVWKVYFHLAMYSRQLNPCKNTQVPKHIFLFFLIWRTLPKNCFLQKKYLANSHSEVNGLLSWLTLTRCFRAILTHADI